MRNCLLTRASKVLGKIDENDEARCCSGSITDDDNFQSQHRENNVWVVGSGDIRLNIVVRNENQLAYETEIDIAMPPGVRLRKAIEFCTIVADPLSLACDVGNPLVKGIPVTLIVRVCIINM